MKKIFAICYLLFAIGTANAVTLTGTAYVNVTSDTSATAKQMAFVEARRQIANEVLSKYSNSAQFKELMNNTNDAQLSKLVSSTSIDGERLSATTYSANIKMTLDEGASQKWLADNNVENWLGAGASAASDGSFAMLEFSGGLRDWIGLNRALRAEKINISIKRISGNQVMIQFSDARRGALLAAVRNAGWNSHGEEGYLRIWK